jgi:flagellar motor switch protein FliG
MAGNDGIERAAILLLGLGEENASEVIRYLEPRQVQKVGVTMSMLANVSQSKIDDVLDDFLAEAKNQTSFGVDTEEYVRNVLNTALGEIRAKPIIDRILVNEQDGGLNQLKWLEGKTVAEVIRNEHPQITATILTYLDSEQAAEVVKHLVPEKRVDVLMRMCKIDSIKPEALNELGQYIEEQMAGVRTGKATSVGGIKSVADLINYLDGSTESQVLDGIADIDDDISEQIQDKMFVFENINDMDGRSVQSLLRDVSSETLMIALKGGTERVKEKIFSNMSKRAADLLRDDLEAQGPVKVSEVEAAQKEILSSARKLAEAGEISLGSKGGEEMI